MIYVFIKSRLNILKTRTVNCAFWHDLKRFGTAEDILKMSLKREFWHYLKRFGSSEKKNENNVSKACILTLKRFWNSEKMLKRSLKREFWHYLKRSVTSENLLKTRSLKRAFWLYLKRFVTSGNCWKQDLLSVHSDTIWNDIGTAEKNK